MSHLGRLEEGKYSEQYSLAPVAAHLSKLTGKSVRLVKDYIGHSVELSEGEIVMLENVRFNVGEKSNDEDLSRRYATLCASRLRRTIAGR